MPSGSQIDDAVDGRTARRDRNRIAVLDAVLELFAEGNLFPSADEVAHRSGVSLRSVYRYVENSDDLIRSAVERHRERVEPLFIIDELGQGSVDHRIDALCRSRVHAYDAVAATARASRARAYSDEVLRAQVDHASSLLYDQVAAQFAPELSVRGTAERKALLAALDALCQIDTIELYRHRRGLSTNQTCSMLAHALRRLLATA